MCGAEGGKCGFKRYLKGSEAVKELSSKVKREVVDFFPFAGVECG